MARTRGGPEKLRRWLKHQTRVNLPAWSGGVHREVHFQLVDGLVSDTPVGNPTLWKHPPPKGYSGGRAKGNWQSSIHRALPGETGRIDPSGRATKAANAAAIAKIQVPVASYISNNVPYIVRLNQAPQWSKQQTPHWFERNLQRVRAQFE